MLGDTEIEPPITDPVSAPIYIPKPKSSLGPILLGFFLVILLSGVIGVVYFKAKFSPSAPSPTPSPAASAEPSSEASASPSATPKSSLAPVSALKPGASPTPTPVPQPTLDIRFGNPSANIKQTIDEGTGDGRVINREYSSIQAGQFDEIGSSWSPRVTVCFHMISNEVVPGKNIKFSLQLDDKIQVEDTLSQYDALEAGRTYDWCHDVTSDIGKHTAKLLLNGDKSVKESNYVNDLASLEWENLADKIAPNFTLGGPYDWTTNGTCFLILSPSDNVTPISSLKVEQKIDDGAWATTAQTQYCFTGTSGDAHSYVIKITDARGNANEQSKSFVLY